MTRVHPPPSFAPYGRVVAMGLHVRRDHLPSNMIEQVALKAKLSVNWMGPNNNILAVGLMPASDAPHNFFLQNELVSHLNLCGIPEKYLTNHHVSPIQA